MKIDFQQIIEVMNRTAESKIAVVGDFCLDKYLYVDSSRDEPSVETGLTAYQVTHKKLYPGVGGTVANNLRALDAQVRCVGLVGNDGEGWELLRCLTDIGADTSLMIHTDRLCTCTYTKPMRAENGVWQEMSRFDFRNYEAIPPELEDALTASIGAAAEWADAVLISDQFLERNCGVITDRVRAHLEYLAGTYGDKIFYADSRGFIGEFRGVTVKCNHLEAVRCVEPNFSGSEISTELLLECGRRLSLRNQKPVVITRGDKGSVVFDGENAEAIEAVRVEGPVDICGAGDANNAGIVLGLTLGLDLYSAAMLGNIVSSVTVKQLGVTGSATPRQVVECAARLA